MTRVAVTGANGFVGAAVVRALEAREVEVRRCVRQSTGPSETSCDLTSPGVVEVLARAFEGADAVVHSAAHVHRPDESPDEIARFREINVRGTERVVDAANRAGVQRIVYVSTIGVHSFHGGGVRTEEDVPDPTTTYGATKLLGESIVTAAAKQPRIARLATVFGRGDRANFARLAHAVQAGRFVIPGDGSARKSVVAVEDAGELLAALALAESAPLIVHLAHPDPVTLLEACRVFASAFGVAMPRTIPIPALRLAARLGDGLNLAGIPFPLKSRTLETLTGDSVVDTRRLIELFPEHEFRRFADVAREAYQGSPR